MPRNVHPLVPLGAVLAVLAALLPVLAASASAATPVTKVLTIVEENHSLAQMQSGMPYAFAQATTYGYATNWTALTHPSLPNYLGIVSGSTHGVTDDNAPSSHPLSGPTVFGQAIAAGRTAKTYAEGMTSNCMLTNTGRYAVKHNGWAYFTAERSQCGANDVPTTNLAGDISAGALPNVGMVVPDLCNDAHDCSLATADAWFKNLMTQIYAGPDWKSGHLAVVLTADEDDKASGNKVLTVVMHPSLAGKVVSAPLTHYSLTRFYEDVTGVSRLNAAVTAPDMAAAFGLTVGGAGTAPTTPAPAPTTTTPPAPTTPAPTPSTTTPAPTPTSAPPAGSGQQAAVVNGWGPVVAGDEFSYTGAPSSTKWSVYNSAGHAGNGLRRPSAWNVDGSVATVTGDSAGTTGGMSARFDKRQYGRWEVRMRTNARDPKYHPVAILWPDGDRTTCPEIDYVESTSDTSLVRFFQHYGCSSKQTSASKAVDMTQWHNYAVEWTPTGITGFLDGAVWFRDSDPSHLPPGSMHQTLQLDWFPDGTATKVSTMSVDWVRVYDLGGSGAPAPAPTTTTPTPAPSTTTPAPAPTTPAPAPSTPAPAPSTPAPAPSTPTPAPAPPAGSGQQAAVVNGWGPVVAGDEFAYTGAPSSTKWSVYSSAGQGGKGLRRPSAWNVDGSVATVTGDSAGTTGGMSARFDKRQYGRWEVRMRTNARDPKYHPVVFLWPDGDRTTCPEIGLAESMSDTSLVRFFQRYGCASKQTNASKAVDMTQWHNYAVEWTPSGVTGYLDGAVWFRDSDLSHLPPGSMHQVLQLDWFPDGTATKVSTMSIDWVRVYDL